MITPPTKRLVRHFRRRAAYLTSLTLMAACAPMPAPQAPTPAEIAGLEAQLQARSDNVGVRLRLAQAYQSDGRPDASAELLEHVVAAEPEAAFLLGVAREDQERYAEARDAYQVYLERGQSAELRRRARDRVALLGRLELLQAVRAALEREQDLAATTPAPRTVGVFPFLLVSNDPELSPLGTALAELLTTDLGQTDRLTVVERLQVRQLLDEMQLGTSGQVDPATAARSGRLLGAGTIIQGTVEGGATDLSVEAAVVRVPTDTVVGDPLRERDALEQIFAMEKRLALGVYERSGIQLTATERQRVMRQPTANIQALLAFGFGLEAQDAGRYEEAQDYFGRAVQLDPAFQLAGDRLREAEAQLRAVSVSPQLLAEISLAQSENLRRQEMFQVVELLVPDPTIREAFPEAAGVEGASRQGTAEIVIRRPGVEQ